MWISSPKEKYFPETIPEESSSTEDEQVVSWTIYINYQCNYYSIYTYYEF